MKDFVLRELKNVKVLTFNVPNKNGRIYTSDCINLNDEVLQEKLRQHVFFGTVDAPEDGAVNMAEISHSVTALDKTEDGLYADIDVLDTDRGWLLNTLLEDAEHGGFRTVGTGNLEIDINNGGNQAVIQYTLESICYFTDPA